MCSYSILNLVRTELISVFILICLQLHHVQGGLCWSVKAKNDRCQGLISTEVSKEDCCSRGGATIAWTSEDLSSGRIFYWTALEGGVPNCKLCKETCDGVKCPQGKKCVMKKNIPSCVCAPDCTKHKHSGPICGTDGKTYRNYCSYLKHKCRGKRYIDFGYYGKCQATCATIKCPENRHCVLDQYKQPHCVNCPQYQCTDATTGPQDYVCGTDGVTYENFCELRKAACNLGRAIQLAYSWKCQGSLLTCNNLKCGADKVCLVERETGHPRCTSCNQTCHHRIPITVCGTDNNTYSSWCELREAACRSGFVIETKYTGPCGVMPTTEPEYIEPSDLETEEEETMDDEDEDITTFNHITPITRFRKS